jgi:drug/metabolite transporter (DMT)-like permease
MKSGWMVVAGFLFALMGVFVKLGAQHFSSAELVFYRSLVGLLVIYAIVRQQRLRLATPHLRMHLWRSLSGFFALMLFFYAISALPLASAITLNYTSPLFLALLLTIVLKQRPQWWLVGALVVGFAGVVLLLNPRFDGQDFLPRLLGLGSGVLAGVAYLNVKQLGQAGEPEWRVVFYFTLVCTIGAGLWMLVHAFHAVSWDTLPILLGLGITATLAQLAMTRAYRIGNTLVVGSLAYSTVVFASLFGILLWSETLAPTSWLAIGLIVASGVISTTATARAKVA